jgi:hypothetical protein
MKKKLPKKSTFRNEAFLRLTVLFAKIGTFLILPTKMGLENFGLYAFAQLIIIAVATFTASGYSVILTRNLARDRIDVNLYISSSGFIYAFGLIASGVFLYIFRPLDISAWLIMAWLLVEVVYLELTRILTSKGATFTLAVSHLIRFGLQILALTCVSAVQDEISINVAVYIAVGSAFISLIFNIPPNVSFLRSIEAIAKSLNVRLICSQFFSKDVFYFYCIYGIQKMEPVVTRGLCLSVLSPAQFGLLSVMLNFCAIPSAIGDALASRIYKSFMNNAHQEEYRSAAWAMIFSILTVPFFILYLKYILGVNLSQENTLFISLLSISYLILAVLGIPRLVLYNLLQGYNMDRGVFFADTTACLVLLALISAWPVLYGPPEYSVLVIIVFPILQCMLYWAINKKARANAPYKH